MRAIGIAVVVAAAASAIAEERAGDTDTALSGVYATEHFEVRYRPGSRAGASAERTGAAAERDLARICDALAVKNDAKYALFLFDDLAELWEVTKTGGNAGFSAGDASYVPFDDDQTRFHEMVHIVGAAKLGQPPTMFFCEGLANALLEHVHGVPVHAVAKHHRKNGKLPPIAEMAHAPDFYAWLRVNPGINAYDVAGSWFRFLLDAHGVAKTKQYYLGKSAKQAFGAEEAALEKAWHAALDKFVLRPEVEALLDARMGIGGVTADVVNAKEGWAPLAASGASRTWTAKDGAITGANDSVRWSVYEYAPDALFADCVFAASVRTSGAVGVQLRLGAENQAMFTNAGVFTFDGERMTSASADRKLGAGPVTIEFAVVRRRGVFEVWLDGRRVASAPCGTARARPGLGVAYGTATFENVRVRKL